MFYALALFLSDSCQDVELLVAELRQRLNVILCKYAKRALYINDYNFLTIPPLLSWQNSPKV